MSEKHQMPGYRPSALGLATKVRIGEPGIETSAYSVVTIIFLLEESLAKMHAPVKSVFLFPPYKGFLRSSRAASVAILPSALFVERFSLGASWASSFQQVLLPDNRPWLPSLRRELGQDLVAVT